jgi:uncharacterized membrane protein/Mg-chelatase subunit ChlD
MHSCGPACGFLLLGLTPSAGVGPIAAVELPSVAFGQPWALLLLLGLLPLCYYSYPPLRVLGPVRCWLVLAVRGSILTALVLALADLRIVRQHDTLTLLIVLDRSYSMPQELEGPSGDAGESRSGRDLRFERLAEAIREATRARGNRRDRIALITFAKQPRLEFPAAELTDLDIRGVAPPRDRSATDIASALRLALASFPEGGGRRILLISDGNENRGDALAEARTARLNRVPIDVVPIRYRYDQEIVADRIDVPKETLENRDLPVRIVLRNYSDKRVSGTLNLWRIGGEQELRVPLRATLDPGLNVLSLRWPADLGPAGGSFSYRAVFVPDGLPGDRPENNEASAPVIVRGEGRRVLVVLPDRDSPAWQPLLDALRAAPSRLPRAQRQRLEVEVKVPEQLPGEKDPRAAELANYDCIFLCNIPADMVPPEKQEALRRTVRDQGCGLVVVGGRDSFGAGRWQGEPLEEALPLDTSIRSLKVQAKGGLVLIMHASEMAEGNYWQKEIARLAVRKLSPQDEVGILYYGYPGGHVWHVPLQPVGPNRSRILQAITTMQPGDMPEFDPSLRMAHQALTDTDRGISTRHIILISDGDHGLLQDRSLIGVLRRDRVTLTTVGITTHGPAAHQALAAISQPLGGRHYPVNNPEELPAIYIKETRVISQSYLYETRFQPELTGERADPLREWNRSFPPLYGYVRTQAKDSPLVQVLMRSPVPGDDLNPLLAQWQYGLGRVVAFTSDAAAGSWARDWVADPQGVFSEFWSRILDWTLRSLDDSGLTLQSRLEGDKVRITLMDNRDKAQREQHPLAGMQLILSAPGGKEGRVVGLNPVSAGVYEAVVEAGEPGSYIATVAGTFEGRDGHDKPLILARDAFSFPYSSEFSAVRSNDGLLQQIAQETGGRVLEEADLAQADLFVRTGEAARDLRPIWYWLVFAAAALLAADVALRRIALEREAVQAWLVRLWQGLRRKPVLPADSQSYLERLKSRKVQVSAALQPQQPPASARFEAPEAVEPGLPTGRAGEPPPKPAPPPAAPTPQTQAEAEDFAARLMRAKKKAREQMEGDQKT